MKNKCSPGGGQNLKTSSNPHGAKKETIIAGIFTVLLVALFVVGITYAANIFEGGSDQNLIKSGKISMHYTESSNVINLTNALPMTDNDGKVQTEYFDFSVSSNADTNADDNKGVKIPYNLIIEPKAVDSDKDALTNEQIKVYLTKIVNGSEIEVLEPTKISKLPTIDTNFNLYSTKNVHTNGRGMITTEYRLRAWIDYDVDASTWSKTSKPKQYKFGVNVDATGKINTPTGAEMIISKVGIDGLVEEHHPETEQLKATTDYRYTGTNPNNYVSFNNENWRIIGVFDTDNGTGKLEQRIKIIRRYSIGKVAWDKKADGSYANDWSKATGMQLLNEGDYWNRTGSYASNGLTNEAKSLIADAKWYLGGVGADYTSTSGGLASHFYSKERGITVYEGNQTSWTGKVGLMYPSDYGYATTGGTSTNRETCLAQGMYGWDGASDCKDNDWLYNSSLNQWTLSPYPGNSTNTFIVDGGGRVRSNIDVYFTCELRPTVYLSSDISITGGTGTHSDPYTLSK